MARRAQVPRLRAVLADIPMYKPGRPAPTRYDEAAGASRPAYKLSSNENPYPPLPSVLEQVTAAARSANRYPDMTCGELVAELAKRFNVPAEHIATGTGSVGVAQQLVQSTAGPGDEIIYAWRSFEAYPIITRISGARAVEVPLTSGELHDLDAMAEVVTDRTRLVFVCNPNNPTGTLVGRPALERFLDRVPDDVVVVLDEAYREFIRPPVTHRHPFKEALRAAPPDSVAHRHPSREELRAAPPDPVAHRHPSNEALRAAPRGATGTAEDGLPDGLDLYRDRPNVCVLRTFSKAYGLAGLRVGFAIAAEPVAAALRKTAVPFGVSQLAQDAAVASLHAEEALLARVEWVVGERERVRQALLEQGWTVPESQANFVWLRLGERTGEFAAACERAGVVVRPFPGEGVRVTVGEAEANDIFLSVAGCWLAGA